MAFLQSTEAVNIEEHDPTFGVKKVSPFLDDNNNNLMRQVFNGFKIGKYDYVSLGYTGSNLTTIGFQIGGVGGTTLGTLTLAYDGSNNLSSIKLT